MPRTKKSIKDKKKRAERAVAMRSYESALLDESVEKEAKKIERDGVGRPKVVTKQVLAKLEHAYKIGCPHVEAAFYADISVSTLGRFRKENPDFDEKIEALRSSNSIAARENVSDAINVKKSVEDSWAWLRTKHRDEFAEQKNLNIKQGVVTAEELEQIAREGIEPDESMLERDTTG